MNTIFVQPKKCEFVDKETACFRKVSFGRFDSSVCGTICVVSSTKNPNNSFFSKFCVFKLILKLNGTLFFSF